MQNLRLGVKHEMVGAALQAGVHRSDALRVDPYSHFDKPTRGSDLPERPLLTGTGTSAERRLFAHVDGSRNGRYCRLCA